MNILFCQWKTYMQKDVELAFKKLGISYTVYRCDFDWGDKKIDIENAIGDILDSNSFDAVFSIDFREDLSIVANKRSIRYISWIVDSPFGISQDSDIMSLSTNCIYIFDGKDYKRCVDKGVNTVYHMSLAANVDRIEKIVLSKSEREKYRSDVSFVGKLYPSTFNGFMKRLTDFEASFINDVIERQSDFQGEYLLDELTNNEEYLKSIQLTLEGEYRGHDEIFHESLQSIISKEITRRDRLTMLMFLSEILYPDYKVTLYSDASDPLLSKVYERGTVDSFEDVFKVYKMSKINLNMTFRRIATGIPLRAIEIMAARGFLLSNYQQELVEQFTPGVDCEVYSSFEEAADKVRYYLCHEDKREEIAKNGYEKVRSYTYENRIKEMIEAL